MPPAQGAAASFWLPSVDALIHTLPLLALIGTIVAILVAALVVGRSAVVSAFVTIVGAGVTALLCFYGTQRVAGGGWAGFAPAGGAPMLLVDNFSILFIALLCFFLVSVVGLWTIGASSSGPDATEHAMDAPEFFTLLVSSAFGMALMVSTTNLLMIVLAVETASLPSYAIVGFRKRDRIAAEASLKYVLFGAVTSAMMIYGISLLYGFCGSFDLVAVAQKVAAATGGDAPRANTLVVALALFGLLAGIGFKISAVPFHFWCPDVFQGATIEVTTWLSVASKAAGLGLLLRCVTALGDALGGTALMSGAATGIGIVAAITCTYGNLAAYRQTNIKRLLAYSSIAHAGYMLMAGAILWRPGPAEVVTHPAFSALVAYVVIYLFMNLGAFGSAALVYWQTGKETLDAYHGLGRRAPWLAAGLAICLFSLVGLPPLGGFIAKFYLLWALFDGDQVWLVWVAVVNTLISLYYYARVAYAMYFVDDGQPRLATPFFGQALVTTVAAVLLLVGVPLAGGLKARADQFSRNVYPVRTLATTGVAVAPAVNRPELSRPPAAASVPPRP
ncbi:MAG: NADH-quinone oxidoreductase subunit N [Phycisphaerae bacterium]|nr:NADH-quinone oxidoreductase subunit N [Phycisphaerae bacterium]